MKERIKHLATNLTLMAVSLVFAVGMAEIGLRVFAEPPFERHHQQLFVEYDPLLGWRKIPGKTATHVTTEYEVTESFNSRGIRGPEYSYEKDVREFRILVLGDSFAEGYTVEFTETAPQVLKNSLQALGNRDYSVINAGTGGYSTDQEYLFFESEGYKYNPDLTILMYYANDITGNVRNRHYRGYKPKYNLESGELKLTNVPVPEPEIQQADKQKLQKNLFHRTRIWLNENTRLYPLAKKAITDNYDLYALAIKLGLADSPGDGQESIPVPEELRVWARTYDTQTQQAWQTTEALLVKVRDAVTRSQSRLMVLYVPSSAAVYDQQWQATKRKFRMSDDEWSIHQVANELESVCRRNNIDFVDPTAQLAFEARRLEEQGTLLYFPRDRHWTAEGHEVVADVMLEYICKNLAHCGPHPGHVANHISVKDSPPQL